MAKVGIGKATEIIHKRVNSLLGQKVGFGISHEVLKKSFTQYLKDLNAVPVNWAPLPVIPLGVRLTFDATSPKSALEVDGGGKLSIKLTFTLTIVPKDDNTKIFRKWDATCAQACQVALTGSGKLRFESVSSISPAANPQGPADQALIAKYYPKDPSLYGSHETAILLNLPTMVATLIEQIPFPDVLTNMVAIRLGAGMQVYYDAEFVIVASPRVDLNLPSCASIEKVLPFLKITNPTIAAAELAAPSTKPVKARFSVEHTYALPTVEAMDVPFDVQAFLYYGKSVGIELAANSILTKLAYKEKDEGESFFVRWWYQFSAAIKSASVLFDPAAMQVSVKVSLTGDGTASGTLKVGCVDIISEVVAINGSIDGELKVGLDKSNSANFKDVRLTAALVASNPSLSVSGLPFPLNLVINIIFGAITTGFGRRTVAEMVARFDIPLLKTVEAFLQTPLPPWISRQHLTNDSQMITLGND